MRMVILSGKGGTGKSCVTSALASTLEHVLLVDADVDCPNQHILFRGKERGRTGFSASKLALVRQNKPIDRDYTGICQFGAISRHGDKVVIDETRCEGCKACQIAFPELDIGMVPRQSGDIIVKETARFILVYGKLVPGEAGSGRVVYEIRRMADRMASEEGASLILVDAPAGIGCPVIAAVTGCDHALGVVEPTPASIANLERALEVVEHFNIPYSIVMNKVGISDSYEKVIRESFGDRIIGEIPYDEETPRLLAEGIPPVEGQGRAAESLRGLCQAVKGLVRRI
jgi:MinD superfamily P-loop ATPase